MQSHASSSANPKVLQFERERTRLESLKTRGTQVQVQLEAARQQLEEARREAREQFGTDDLASLKDLLAKREQDNQRAQDEFVTAVNSFETSVTRLEHALADPKALAILIAGMDEAAAEEKANQEAAQQAAAAAAPPAFSEDDI